MLTSPERLDTRRAATTRQLALNNSPAIYAGGGTPGYFTFVDCAPTPRAGAPLSS
jgi:hypothetical protein